MIAWGRCRRLRRPRPKRSPGESVKWRTVIYYREPTYDLRRGGPPRVFEAALITDAPSAEIAAAKARKYFNHMAAVSQVGWVREIDRIEVEPACTRFFNEHGAFIGWLH